RMTRRSLSGLSAAVLGFAMLAWSGCESAVPEVTVVQPAPPGTTTAVVTESKLSAANMAALVLAANNATIERAQYARTHAASPEVRAFADRIFSESQAAN